MSTKPGSPSTTKPSFNAKLYVLAITESLTVALGSLTRRATSTFVVEADSVSPPAWRMKSSMVSLSAYLYIPGYCTSPWMVMVRSTIASWRVGTNKTSFSLKGMSATLPLIMPPRSTLNTSSVRSAFILCITPRLVKACSVIPSACSMSVRTLLICSPSWYMPGRNTAPFISTVFSYRGNIESTLTESPSAIRNDDMSNSLTLNTEYSLPVFLNTLTDLV